MRTPTTLFIMAATLMPAWSLTQKESELVLFMRQEEQLAHDVYAALFEKWGQSIFSNIARSESRHVDSVKGLIAKFNLDDTTPSEPGTFTIPSLQTLHDDLLEKGERSLIDALLVGVLIEETDIADLTAAIEASEDVSVISVFSNLRSGSENHLRSFNAKLAPLYTKLSEPSLEVTFDSNRDPVLSWGNVSEGAQTILIERRPVGGLWTEIHASPVDTLTHIDTECSVAATDYRLRIESNYESYASDPVRCLRPFSTYHAWASFAFGTASDIDGTEQGDPDRDQISNLVEYAMGSDPTRPDSVPIVSASMVGGKLTMTGYWRAEMSALSMSLESSGDLMEWTVTSPLAQTVRGVGIGIESFQFSIANDHGNTRFARLSLNRAP